MVERRSQSWPRRLRGPALVVLLGVLVMIVSIRFLQDSVLYQPARYSVERLARVAAERSLALWPTSDNGYLGLVTQASSGIRGTVVVLHGNAGSAPDRQYYMAALEPLGFRVVLAEYPGYGAREGKPTEETLMNDARNTVVAAERDFGGPVYLWGESLGCGVAAGLAADPDLPVEALALITPFTTLPDLAQALYWFLPVRWLVRDQYDNVANLKGFEKPVALLVAERDELMPRAQADALYESLTTQKRMWVFPGAGHNTWPVSPQETWWQEVAVFLEGD